MRLHDIKDYQEEEGGTFSSNGRTYDLNQIFLAMRDAPLFLFNVDDLKWVLKYDDPDPERVANADLLAPILVTEEDGFLIVVDGLHRLTKAVASNQQFLPGRYVPQEIMDSAEIIDCQVLEISILH